MVGFESLVFELKRVFSKMEKLEARRRQILEELSQLKTEKGTLEYKPVKNKAGQIYHYWYLRKWENGRLRSIYLGAKVPESLFQRIQDRNKARRLLRELRDIEKELRRIRIGLDRVQYILFYL